MSELILNDDTFKMLNVIHKIKKTLQREKKIYQSVAFHRVGSGLTEAEFNLCVSVLAQTSFCIVSIGDRDAVVLTLNEEFANAKLYEPAEVIEHAMQCPPITKIVG